MKYLKRFENYKEIDLLPPPPIDIDSNDDDDGDSQVFKYDFEIYGLRYDILTTDSIKDEIDRLNWDSNGVIIQKYQISHGNVCFKIKNFFQSKDTQYLLMDAYYSLDDNLNTDRLNMKEFLMDVNKIIYNTIEYPFKYINNSGYDNWKKSAWLELS